MNPSPVIGAMKKSLLMQKLKNYLLKSTYVQENVLSMQSIIQKRILLQCILTADMPGGTKKNAVPYR